MINKLKSDIRRIEYEIGLMKLNPNKKDNVLEKEEELNYLVEKLSTHVDSSNNTCCHEWNEWNICVHCSKNKYYL